jgi:hypothetical protein
MTEKNLSPKEYSERENKIQALAQELGTTRAHAASIVDAEAARAGREEAKEGG